LTWRKEIEPEGGEFALKEETCTQRRRVGPEEKNLT